MKLGNKKKIGPESSYNRLRAWGEPPMGASLRKTTPSMSKAIPNEGLLNQPQLSSSYVSRKKKKKKGKT